ncbi:MAG: Fic family protein [Clostridia bacterium]|nr:hypothetical protein [Clostridiales bacterium]MBQ3232736.1 Fic family protein [Clostridia bacterium]
MNEVNGGKHCYPGTNVLINKYGIHDAQILEKLEIQKTAVKLLGLDIFPQRIKPTFDVKHLTSIHLYLFGDLYSWAGEFRQENFFKSERVLSGASAEYADYTEIEQKIKRLLSQYKRFDWHKASDPTASVSEFLIALWSIHPFREGNTRTCITFLWHYLNAKKVRFQVELFRNNPMYVRDSLVMANYGVAKYLNDIIHDALSGDISPVNASEPARDPDASNEQYQISKAEYELFKEKYRLRKR